MCGFITSGTFATIRIPWQNRMNGRHTSPCSFFTACVRHIEWPFHLAMFSNHVSGAFTGQ